jgi:ABC-2 type transport system permease protein
MNLRRVGRLLAKDLRLGPRSPLVLWALVLPVALTLLLRAVFGGLLDPHPRLGITDAGSSAALALANDFDGLEVRTYPDGDALQSAVADGAVDAGIALPPGFDAAVRRGDQPPLQLWISGRSGMASRGTVIAAILGIMRDLSGAAPPVEVEVVSLGEPGLPMDLRLLPLLVIVAVAIAGGMVPAASLVEEKEKRTLQALLVSPTSVNEVLLAKGLLGWILAMAAGVVTLALNAAFGAQPLATLLGVAVGAVMMAQVGLLLGCWAPDTNTLFAAWKGGALLLLYPVIAWLWPELPGWIARLGPTYYFLQPIFAVSVEGAGLRAVGGNLAIAGLICVALTPAVAAMGRRLQRRLGEGHVRPARQRTTPAPTAS